MRNSRFHFPSLSPIALAGGTVGVLAVVYIGLIAAVMSYAALTVEFAQSVKNDEASVASLESQYLAAVASITTTNYVAEGYVVPSVETFVSAKSATALR
ncbi:hypothetical protein HKL94_02080 [Candidatus Parcubacteria bacterium]|nr:hypothetical protein [Candidatus Parcubacteria bacterium]